MKKHRRRSADQTENHRNKRPRSHLSSKCRHIRFCSDPTGAELRDDYLFSLTAAVIRSGPPGSVLLAADWSWRGTGLYFMNVTLQRGDREPEPEPEPGSLLSADFTQIFSVQPQLLLQASWKSANFILVDKLCNYIVTWCTAAQEEVNIVKYASIKWKINISASQTARNELFKCQNLILSVSWVCKV